MTYKNQKITLSFLTLVGLLFSIVFDPGNIHFGLKNIFFFLFCLINIKIINNKYIFVPLILICIFFISYTYGVLVNSRMDTGIARWYLTSFIFIVILLFIEKKEIFFFKYLYYMSLLLTIYILMLTIILFMLPSFSELVGKHIYNNRDFVMFGYREALGIKHFCLYYRTSSICVLPEGCSLCLYYKTGKKKFLIHSILFAFELFISGARANMVCALIIPISFYLFYSYYTKRRIFLTTTIVSLFIIGLGTLILKLILEKESSNTVKLGHAQAFLQLFNENFVRFFFLGSGPGSYIFSLGTNMEQPLTELSYFELIKSFGFISTVVIIGLFLIPIYKLIHNKKNDKTVSLTIIASYFCFFLIAGTNPLFIGSTGFSTIISMFYLCDKSILSEFGFSSYYKKTTHERITLKYLI